MGGNTVTKILNQTRKRKAFYSNDQSEEEQEVIISVHQQHSTTRSLNSTSTQK